MPEIDGGLWKEMLLSMLEASVKRTKGPSDAEMASAAIVLASSARCVSIGTITGEGWDIPSGISAALDMDWNKPVMSMFTLDGEDRIALAANISGNILSMSFTKVGDFWAPDPVVLHISSDDLSIVPFFASQTDLSDDRWVSHGMAAAAIVGRTASILSCSNVHPSLIEPTAAIRRGRMVAGLEPKYAYETLGYTAFSESGKRAVVDFDDGRIRVYSKDKPLFGKHAGKFWLPTGAKALQVTQSENKEQNNVPRLR